VKWKSWHVYIPKSQEPGYWKSPNLRSYVPICVARCITIPKEQTLPVRVVNLDPLPITLHKTTKIAVAKLIREEAICSTSEDEPPRDKEMIEEKVAINLQHPLPSDITERQKEQFLAMMSQYSEVIAKGPNDLGCTKVH